MKQRRRLRKALAVFALVALGTVLLLRTDRAGEWACSELRARLPEALGADVSIGRCELDPLSASARLKTVSVTLHGAERPVLEAEEAAVSLRGLFPGGVALQHVTVIRPHVEVVLKPAPAVNGKVARVCPLEALQHVRVGELEVQGASLSVRLPDGREVKLDGVDVKASLTRKTAQVEATARSGTLFYKPGRPAALGRTSAEVTLELDDRTLEVRRADTNVEGITASAQGLIEGLCDEVPKFGLTGQAYVPMAALPRLGVPLDAPSGQVWSRLSVTGRADAPVIRAELQATQVVIGPFTPGDFTARLALVGQDVKIEEFVTRSGDGDVKVSGELKLTSGLPVKLRVETHDASFARVMERAGVHGPWVEFAASAKGVVTGHLLPLPSLGGDIEFHTGRFTLASRAWDAPATRGVNILTFASSAGTFHLGVSDQGVTFDDVAVRVGPAGRTQASGVVKIFYDPARGLDIRVRADAIDLADFGSIAELPWQGVGNAQATILGPTADVVIDGRANLRDFKLAGYALGVVQSPVRYVAGTLSFPGVVAQKGRTQYFGGVELIFGDKDLYTRASVQLPDGRVEDMVDLLADLSPLMQNLQGPLVGRLSAVAVVDSPAKELTGVIAMHLRDVEFYDRRVGAGAAVLKFDHGDALVLDPTTLEGPLGKTTAEGRWAFAGPLDYQVAIDNGSLAELIDPSGADAIPVSGSYAAKATVGGDTDTILVDGAFTSPDVIWKGRPLGPSKIDVHEVGRDLRAEGVVFPGLKGHMDLHARNDWPEESAFTVDLADLSPFLPPSVGLAVGVAGSVTASGPLLNWRGSRATANLDRLTLARGEVTAANVGPVELGWNAGAFEVRSLALKGPTTEVRAEGTWGPAMVDLKSQGSVDLRLLGSFVPDLERTAGKIDFTVSFGGPVSGPTLIGRADLSDARATVRGQDLSIKALSGRADFSESRVLIHDVQGFLNDGRVRGRGDVRLERFSVKTMELQADIEDVTVQVRPDITPRLTGALLLASRNGTYQLGGSLDVVKLHYTQSLQLESILASARNRGVPSDDKPVEWLKYDVDIAAGEDVRIENNLARARLLGKLKLTGTNVRPVLIGAVEAGEGAQAWFRGNSYSVGRALLQFNGLWPTFDLSATSQVREYLVSVKAFGKLEDPKVSLTSEPALSEADIVSLLTVGVTTREKFASQSGIGLAGEALLSASGLDQQLQRFLSRSVGFKDQQVRLTTTFNEATGTAEPSVTWESKVLSDNLKVGVTQPVTGRGTKAQVEYRFNQSVSARGQWDNQNQNTSVGNPGVDLRFRFEWE